MFRRRNPALNRQVLVSLFSGNAISGVLVADVGGRLILKGCTVHEPGVEPATADGEIVIDKANVDYMQIP
ncbi:hypothetical protein SEA_PHRANN_3 [Mycobacterium phage Phrann]|uniref:Uncharacterized protein n=4 Tax=Charlievirus TaxID=1623280 RepID=A0A1I9SC57_9CAUD|nr:hypothetical protein BJD68_gp03 [Mycobacterium phage Phrann]YP_009304911.1 hypothetical protein BJD70_gp03 [Mycobacterium phage Panchino]YP_010051804.1 hypothetical protein KD927_gp03 [Mycobacterium phage Raymond7]AOZ64434.1 hypothetical protein SEA_PHANCYPHIN_3 [Mycobacterium phage PhancyPhin]OKH68069.1 hypothetical protein EB74_34190 [Mycobacterium sp. SWH-M5]WAA19724.1 hypothetical protein SEA_SHWETA_3 [Mycobacterium phage Shweta]AMS02021.1 hypothetical protein SEA_PANCHINO_3 [Mycobacte